MGRASARVVPLRPATAGAGPDPARGLRATGARDHHDPNRSCALALRTGIGAWRARSSVACHANRSGPDRHQRRLPRPRRHREREDAPDRLAIRPYGHSRTSTGVSQHPRRARCAEDGSGAARACRAQALDRDAACRPDVSDNHSARARSAGALPTACPGAACSRHRVRRRHPRRGRARRVRRVDERRLPPRPRVGPACAARNRPRGVSRRRSRRDRRWALRLRRRVEPEQLARPTIRPRHAPRCSRRTAATAALRPRSGDDRRHDLSRRRVRRPHRARARSMRRPTVSISASSDAFHRACGIPRSQQRRAGS